jgi:hypothetical protein
VPLQDIHELRKTIDSFYYKNIWYRYHGCNAVEEAGAGI